MRVCFAYLLVACLICASGACSDDPSAGSRQDAALGDGLAVDRGPATPDGALTDSATPDRGTPDAAAPDSMMPDSTTPDTAAPDSMMPDSVAPDSMMPDSMMPDSMMPDSATPDSMMPDVAPPDVTPPVDLSPDGYNTSGWTMKTKTLSDSASTGTPDSYFFSVDPGSPLSASIVGGGSGSWSVNVYGGSTNTLYPCSGSALCQVMLDPQDTTVIITAITTGIGYYTLTVKYSGAGL